MDPSAIDVRPSNDLSNPLSRHFSAGPQHYSATHARQCKTWCGWRRIVVNLTPAWFSVTTGTGITSILIHNLPYNGRWLYYISIVLFALNIAIFLLLSVMSVLRYTLFHGMWSSMLAHPVQSLFLGTIPMGLATIINMIVFVCVPAWGSWAAILAWVLWWIDVILALGTNLLLPFRIMYKHESQLSSMTATWLLPIVATIVAAATGSIVAGVLPNDQHALWTVIVSYILWGCGVPLALFTMVIYFHRLTMYSLPPREVIVSVFLPLGPIGQGAFGIMTLGHDALTIFNRTQTIPLVEDSLGGRIFYINGLFIGIIMWGFGIVWLFFAIASLSRTRFPFNLGWWGFTFPLGVYATATVQISKELPSLFFKVLGTIFSLAVVLLWAVVSVGTVWNSLSGELFVAPCVKEWEIKQVEKENQKQEGDTSV
ncbi:sulfite transporter Ssu1 [Dendryphion nanum]|uniref:Sulfite efflux pump SSU1 n=1 Tax=Dendryphion nanum TaxID=256645 RepID=A0A9P9CZ15_9PLEO|nr:sulfite transporter Ssu1 [Dendryphion nanum]